MASTYLALNVHVIFATHGRAPMISDSWRPDFHAYLGGCLKGHGAIPTAVGGVADHVHLLVGLRATHSLADLVREVKKASSIWARERFDRFAWQEGYAAFTVSPGDVRHVVTCIMNQEEHHRSVTSSDELRALMEAFGMVYDDRFFE